MANFRAMSPPQPLIRPPMQQQMAEALEPPGAEPGEGSPEEEAQDIREMKAGAPPSGDHPPSERDKKQSITHHVSSMIYNAKHGSAHDHETAKHAGALLELLKKMPGFSEHAKKV